jgi:DNA-binding IscR family transcriptional regulator
LVTSRRGGSGGYQLAHAPAEITVADVIRTVDGPIVSVRGERPTSLTYTGSELG